MISIHITSLISVCDLYNIPMRACAYTHTHTKLFCASSSATKCWWLPALAELTLVFPGVAHINSPASVFLQPERISGEQYGIHSDVWSLGISFMEVCCLQVDASMYIHSSIRKNEDLKNNNNKPPRCYVYVYTELNSRILLLSLSGL